MGDRNNKLGTSRMQSRCAVAGGDRELRKFGARESLWRDDAQRKREVGQQGSELQGSEAKKKGRRHGVDVLGEGERPLRGSFDSGQAASASSAHSFEVCSSILPPIASSSVERSYSPISCA